MSDSDKNSSDQTQTTHAYNWLGDHGQVGFEQLKALAQAAHAGETEAWVRLHALADDNNIPYDAATDPMKLAEEINTAIETDANTGVE